MDVDQYQFAALLYDGSKTAGEALEDLDGMRKDGAVNYKDAVAVYKKKGKVKLIQTKEKKGILGGGILGLIIGAILGGPILGAALGALIGGTVKRGFNNKEIKKACEEMDDDESILFVAVEETDYSKIKSSLPDPKAMLYREVVPVEVIAAYENVSESYETTQALDKELKEQEEED